MSEAAVGTIEDALRQAARLLDQRPDLAAAQAREILRVAPNDPRAATLLGGALRRGGDVDGALAILEPVARQQARAWAPHLELGLALQAKGEGVLALAALRQALALNRDLPQAWRAIGDQLHFDGDRTGADAAYAEHIRASVQDPRLRAAAEALRDDNLPLVERLLRGHLKAHPTDVAAMRMLAEAGTRLGRLADAQVLLSRCLELAPSFTPARYNLALVLYRQQNAREALPHVEALLAIDPADRNYRVLHAACLGLVGEYARAIDIYQGLLAELPGHARTWLSLGHALRTEGRRPEAVAAYKRAAELEPGLGDAYWSLANLKTEPFLAGEVEAMAAQLRRDDLADEDRLHLDYALGKALEDAGDFAASFAHYAKGAALRRKLAPYSADETSTQAARHKTFFTRAFFADRAEAGAPSEAPIFIVGLPRSGSTLIEQILASHSQVEGTMELPEVAALSRAFDPGAKSARERTYPDSLAELSGADFARLGETFLDRTRVHRKLGRPRFIDKMPNNFNHIGLIHLIFPRARIIDARRHPMAACFSAFKQHFARGQGFSYDLTDLGRYYRDYLGLMAHFDAVLPGRVLRVIYEDMVEDTEGQTRRLLHHCGLDFEPACLSFYDNTRAVRTASSEQVRRPIFREGLDQWRRYEPWLGPLAEALGPALTTWRD
jgi:tetratricopeptide (TPR) repeat protein